jgi:hypothetical protein
MRWFYLGPDATTTPAPRYGLRVGVTEDNIDKLSRAITWEEIWKNSSFTLWRGKSTGNYQALCSFLTGNGRTPANYHMASSIRAIQNTSVDVVTRKTQVSFIWSTATASDPSIATAADSNADTSSGVTVLRVNDTGTFAAVPGYYTDSDLTDVIVAGFHLYTLKPTSST